MGVKIDEIRFYNLYDNSTYTDYLLGNIGDKVQVQVTFTVEEAFVTSNTVDVDRILLAPSPYIANEPNSKDIIYVEEDGALAEFRVGDTIAFYNATTLATFNYEVYEKLVDNSIRVMSVAGTPGDVDFYASNGNVYDTTLPVNSYIYITTPITSMRYKWNMVSNSESDDFSDKIANELNQVRVGGITNLSPLTQMVFDSPVTNDYGTAFIQGLGVGTNGVGQKFAITHNTIITPFFLPGQKFDLEDNIPPLYFQGAECLKYILSVEAGRVDNDPNFIQTVDFAANDGNTGWQGENFNGKTNEYSVSAVRYIRQDLTTIDAVELTDNTQTIEIDVYSNNGTFSNNNSEFALCFSLLPEEFSDIRFNGKTIVENFFFDYAQNTVGSAAVAGDNNGTDYEVFNQVSATFVDANNITITAQVDLTAAGVTDLTARDFEYFLFLSVSDYTLSVEDSDRVTLKAAISPFYIDLTDDGMITQETKFLRHYESDFDTEGTTDLIARTEDDILGYTQFYLDLAGRFISEITIDSITVELIAKKTTGAEFTLESYTQDFTSYPVLADGLPYIDKNEERLFKMPDLEQRKTISFKRRSDLDTGTLRYFEIKYPFLFRWEYWIPLADASTDTFDPLEPNNGLNEEWHRYDKQTDWNIFYRTQVNATKNNTKLVYQDDTQITTFDYEEDSDWTTETIQALDADTLTDIGVLKAPCRIKASKTYVGGTPPALNDVEWVLRIEVYEQGGLSEIRYLSSVYDWTQYSWFNSVDASNKVFKSLAGSVYSAEALIDFDDLPDEATFKVSARIYNEAALAPIPDGAKLMEDGTVKLMEDGTTKIIE